MENNISILQRLRENNPFASSASPLPWENMNPDLQQLNRSASEEIEQLMRHKRREPNLPLAGLVLGETGSGKTHMLTRILRKLKENSRPAIFVAVRTFRHAERVNQDLLNEIFISLKRTHSNGHSQFDMLAAEVMNTYTERRRNDGFDDLTRLDTRTYLSRDMPNLERNFLKCLLIYLGTSDEKIKADVIDWLNGGLEDEESLKLGLPLKDIDSMSDAGRESTAEKTLISLGIVLAYAKVPMVICFDQLDAMKHRDKDRELIEEWGNIIGLLMNDLSGILPLCFVRAETWNEVFMPVLDNSVVQRLRNNTMVMNTCSAAQAKQLIHEKIRAVFGKDTEEIYNWLINRIGNSLKTGLSPRTVIELANHAIVNGDDIPVSDGIAEAIRKAYEDEYKKIQSEPNSWPPNANNLTLALEIWLSSLEGFSLGKPSGRYIKLQGIHGDRRFAFIILTPKMHTTGIAGLNEGLKFMKEYPGSFCCYVLEEKSHKKTWKKFADKLNEFENAGGVTVRLDREARITWYALTALINRIDNGDVNIYRSSGNRHAVRSDTLNFVRTLKLIDALKVSAPSLTHTPSAGNTETYFDDKILGDTLRSIITASPMSIMNPDKASSLLSQRGINIGRKDLLSFVKDHTDMFRTFRARNDVLIGVTEKQ